MKKFVIVAALIILPAQSTLAQDVFYVIRDNTTNACRVVASNELASTQKARYKQLGEYTSMDEAKAALDSMLGSTCPKM